jgi:hypothetical protein
MGFSRKYQRPIAVSLCLGIAYEGIVYGDREYSCLSLSRAVSVCVVSEAVLPHIEYPDIPTSLATGAISVITSTGTMYHPSYSPLLPASSST